MSWIALDGDACRESVWFLSLSDGQKWAFLSLAQYASRRPRGFVKKMPLELLARRTEADVENLRTMLESAQKWIDPETGQPDPKIKDRGKRWEVMDYDKFNPPREDRTHAERQHRYKERRRQTQDDPRATRSDGGDGGDAGDAKNAPTIPYHTSTKRVSIKDALSDGDTGRGARAACEVWNEMVSDLKAQNPNCRVKPVQFLTDKRRQHTEARLAQKDFDIAALCGKIRGSPYLRGEKGNWVVTFDWVVGSPNNWPKIMEGRYEDAPEPAAGGRTRKYDSKGVHVDTR
jgi:hypothetical protein